MPRTTFSYDEKITGITNFVNSLIEEGCDVKVAGIKKDELFKAIDEENHLHTVEEVLHDLNDSVGLKVFGIIID